MLVGLDPQESATFRDQLLELLSAEEQPEAPDKRPPGADRRLARDTALPRGTPSFAERFPNAAKVRPEGGAFDRRYHR